MYTVVNGHTLEHEARKTRASATAGSIEIMKPWKPGVVRELSEAVPDEVHDHLPIVKRPRANQWRRFLYLRLSVKGGELAAGACADLRIPLHEAASLIC